MAKSFSFNTGNIRFSSGGVSNLTFHGTITRTAKNQISLTCYVTPQYYMEISYIYFHIAYGTSNSAWSGSYNGISTSGFTEMTSSGGRGGIQFEVITSTGGGNFTICSNQTFWVPDNALYFSVWFTAPSYYHVEEGYTQENVAAGATISQVLDRYYTAPSSYNLQITGSTVDTITAKHSWTNGSDTVNTRTITIGDNVQTVNNGSSYTFTGLKSNTKYTVNGKISDGTTTLTGSGTRWTYPKIKSLVLSLPSGKEHDEINAEAIPDVSSNYDQFSFKLDSNEFSAYSSDATKLYSGLEGHSTHSVTTKMKNTDSAYESEEVTESITTWYDPIYSLSVTLVNKWFWFISTKATFDYQGGVENIKKYEFSIGNEAYQDKDTINAYSKGTTTPGESDNLAYNTDYICKVKLTDNHGRTKEASATFKTLDERPLFVNGTLREVKVIKPDGSVHYITPNLLSVVKPDNSVINMNKIINGDDRTEYK